MSNEYNNNQPNNNVNGNQEPQNSSDHNVNQNNQQNYNNTQYTGNYNSNGNPGLENKPNYENKPGIENIIANQNNQGIENTVGNGNNQGIENNLGLGYISNPENTHRPETVQNFETVPGYESAPRPINMQNQENAQHGNNSNMFYPNPQLTKEIKPKKKRKLFGVFKLTASAVAFGLIAGVVFQAYYFATMPKTNDMTEKENVLQIAKVVQEEVSKDTIQPTGASLNSIATDVSDVVANVMPSIVAINSSGTATKNDFFGRTYEEPMQGSGSGIIIGQNGSEILIVTNNHVIEGSKTREIVFDDGSKASAIVKGAEANADLAVLSVNLSDLSKETAKAIKVASLGNSDELKAGEMAIAIGNALGYGQSVTVGYISAVNREVTIANQTMTLLQTDAAINPGNSGGALINSSGQVIGINSVKFASEAVEGMGYAIPITNAIPMINELMNREVIAESEKGFLGIDTSTAQEVTELFAARFNMPIGIYVNDIVANSPAEEAGLTQGDIITGVNELKVETIEDLISALSYKKAADKIKLKIQVKENGSYVEKTLDITLAARKQ